MTTVALIIDLQIDISWRYMDGKLGRGMDNAQIRALLRGGQKNRGAHPS
jgi:hypothetical protein